MVMLAANCSDAETEESGSRPLGRIVSFVKIKFQNTQRTAICALLGSCRVNYIDLQPVYLGFCLGHGRCLANCNQDMQTPRLSSSICRDCLLCKGKLRT